MALLYGDAGRLTAENGGFRPRRAEKRQARKAPSPTPGLELPAADAAPAAPTADNSGAKSPTSTVLRKVSTALSDYIRDEVQR